MAKGRLVIPLKDFAEIRNSPEVVDELEKIGDDIRQKAEDIAGRGHYEVETISTKDRTRVYVRAEGAAIPIEAKDSPLLQIVGNDDTYSAD